MDWVDAALAEIDGLSDRLVLRHAWAPSVGRGADHLDLFVWIRRRAGADHVLRVRYLADWRVAGRREDFVDPEDFTQAGPCWWPQGVHGVNAAHGPPCICLRGFWGFHSVLHPGGEPAARPLGVMLRDLQTQMDRAA